MIGSEIRESHVRELIEEIASEMLNGNKGEAGVPPVKVALPGKLNSRVQFSDVYSDIKLNNGIVWELNATSFNRGGLTVIHTTTRDGNLFIWPPSRMFNHSNHFDIECSALNEVIYTDSENQLEYHYKWRDSNYKWSRMPELPDGGPGSYVFTISLLGEVVELQPEEVKVKQLTKMVIDGTTVTNDDYDITCYRLKGLAPFTEVWMIPKHHLNLFKLNTAGLRTWQEVAKKIVDYLKQKQQLPPIEYDSYNNLEIQSDETYKTDHPMSGARYKWDVRLLDDQVTTNPKQVLELLNYGFTVDGGKITIEMVESEMNANEETANGK